MPQERTFRFPTVRLSRTHSSLITRRRRARKDGRRTAEPCAVRSAHRTGIPASNYADTASAFPTDSGRKVAALAAQLLRLADVTIIASARDNLEHKSSRKLAPVHGRFDNPLCNLSMWFLKARRHRTTTNPNRRPTTCCQDAYFYYLSS